MQIEFSKTGTCDGLVLWIDWVMDAENSIVLSTGPGMLCFYLFHHPYEFFHFPNCQEDKQNKIGKRSSTKEVEYLIVFLVHCIQFVQITDTGSKEWSYSPSQWKWESRRPKIPVNVAQHLLKLRLIRSTGNWPLNIVSHNQIWCYHHLLSVKIRAILFIYLSMFQ